VGQKNNGMLYRITECPHFRVM